MSMRRAIHDLWCGITHICRVPVDHDDTIRRLIAEEQAADQNATDIRARRVNVLEAELIRARITELKRKATQHE